MKTPTAALSRAPDPANDDDELEESLLPSVDELDFELGLDSEPRSGSARLDEFHLRNARAAVLLQLLGNDALVDARAAREADARVRS